MKPVFERLLAGIPDYKSFLTARELDESSFALAKEYHPDYVLAIGGGSVMDTAKFICAGYYSFHDLHDC